MEIVLLLIRLFLFGVFALAGIGKLMDIEGSEKAVRAFGVPEPLVKPIGTGLPVFELVLAFFFLFVTTSWFAAIAGLLLILSFLAGMIYQIAQGNAPDCHCFGQIHSEPVGKSSLLRNAGFGLLALFLAVQGSSGQGPSLAENEGGMTSTLILVLLLAAVAVAVAVFYLRRILDQQAEILKRIDLLEIISRDGAHVERDEAVPPTEGLAIGSPFPEFELTALDGSRVTRSEVLSSGRPALVFFVSPDCSPCKALYPEIRDWQQELGEKLDFVFVSTGKLDANREKYGDTEGIRVIVQEKRELAELVKAQWTPTALFVTRDGTIGSYVSAGDNAIRQLVDDVRERDLDGEYVYVANMNGVTRPMRIGESIPEFSVDTVNNGPLTTEAVKGKKTLAVFWSLTCPHCINMKDALAEWDGARGMDDPGLIVFSNGEVEENRELGFKSPVVVDKGYEISKKLGMFGTPSAVVIDENGVIASSTATGAENIWALIGKPARNKAA